MAKREHWSFCEDVRCPVVDLLADMPGARNNFVPPTEGNAEACREVGAMSDVPLPARQSMRALRLGDFTSGAVVGVPVAVVFTNQDDQAARQKSWQVARIEVDAAHACRIVDARIRQHVNAAIGGDGAFDERRL